MCSPVAEVFYLGSMECFLSDGTAGILTKSGDMTHATFRDKL